MDIEDTYQKESTDMTKNTLKQGQAYAKRLFKSVGITFSAELMEPETGPTSLIIGDQAVIYNDHEAGEIKLNVYPVSITLGQMRKMFGVANEDDKKPPTPNYVPVEDIFDAVRRATFSIMDLRVKRAAADLANEKEFQTGVDVVSHIPDRVVAIDAPPSTELALPGFDISKASPNMRTYISREDWRGAFSVYAIRTEIPVEVRNSHTHFMGDRNIRAEGCFTQDGYIATPGYGDPNEKYKLPRLGQCLAKKEGDDDYRIWVFDFRDGLNSVASVAGLTEKQLNHYFTREITDDTETDISVRYVTSYGITSREKNSRTSVGSLHKLTVDDFTDKVTLPSGFATEYRKSGNGILIEAHGSAFNKRAEIALMPLKDGSVMRIMVTDYARAVKEKGVITDIPVRIWDRKKAWKDDVIKVSVKEDEDHTGPYIHCESKYPEINDRLSFMELNSTLRKLLPQKPKKLIAPPVALQNPTSINEVREHQAPPVVASVPGNAGLSQGQVALPKSATPNHE